MRRNRIRRTLPLLMALAICTTLFSVSASAATKDFTDVPSSHWAHAQIAAAVEGGITSGYADGTFKPAASVTNAHFSAFIARAFFPSDIKTYEQRNPNGEWWASSVYTLEANNIYVGTKMGNAARKDGNYAAVLNQPIDRYNMAQIMYNVLKLNMNTMPEGSKTGIGDWNSIPVGYQDAVSVCYALGVLNGQADGTFGGNNSMNRAQGCVVIARLKDYIANGSVSTLSTPSTPAEEPGQIVQEPESTKPVTSAKTLANGKEVTEENVLEILEELKKEYPEGTSWTAANSYHSAAFRATGTGCAGYAFMISDKIFGALPVKMHQNYDKIRPGDVIHFLDSNGNNVHWSVVTVAPDSEGWFKDTGAGSSADSTVVWDQWCSPEYMDNEVVYTRYPD